MTAESQDRFTELIPIYALGALAPEEAREVEEHLASDCAACRHELREASRQLELLAEAVPPVAPSEVTRARVLRIAAARPAGGGAPAAGQQWGWPLTAAAAVVLLVWSGWSQIGLRREVGRLASASDKTWQELAVVRADLDRARLQLRQAALANRIVASPRMQAVLLAGLTGAPGASAQTLVDPTQSKAVFYASNLPPAPAGKTYQLWFITGGHPVSGGVFDVDAEGGASLVVDRVAALDSIDAWAVTVEPAGGVPQPTGEMVLKS